MVQILGNSNRYGRTRLPFRWCILRTEALGKQCMARGSRPRTFVVYCISRPPPIAGVSGEALRRCHSLGIREGSGVYGALLYGMESFRNFHMLVSSIESQNKTKLALKPKCLDERGAIPQIPERNATKSKMHPPNALIVSELHPLHPPRKRNHGCVIPTNKTCSSAHCMLCRK